MRNFLCYYCQQGAENFSDIISHLCEGHNREQIKFRSLELNEVTGKLGYRTKHFADTTAASHNITVTGDHELSIVQRNSDTDEESHAFEEPDYDAVEAEISQLYETIPTVIEKLKQYGQLDLYIKWCNLVAANKFPLDNICYLLFLDVVQWFSSSQTSQMRYFQEETLNFWKVGYRLFHGKFLRFMGGPRNSGQIITGDKEERYCLPQNSKVNFAVPSKWTLNQEKLNPLYPGVFVDSIKVLSDNIGGKSIKVGIDGKKIARGKGNMMGDIDCWGFEPAPTLSARKTRYEEEQQLVSDVYTFAEKTDNQHDFLENAQYFQDKVKCVIIVISKRLKDLREARLKVDQVMNKLFKMGEVENSNWKTSRYAPAISSLKVSKYDIDQGIKTALELNNSLCNILASLNNKKELYSESGFVDVQQQQNYYHLRENTNSTDPRLVKQRSKVWHDLRNTALVTGSTCNKAVGLGKLKEQQSHFDNVILGKKLGEFTDQQKKNMEYGTQHEIDGVATICARVLPAFFPDLQYFEEGCVCVPHSDKRSFMVVSPDGSFRRNADSAPEAMYENKCKTHNDFTVDVHYTIPQYYIPQVMCEMKAYECSELLFSCWTKQSTTVLKVTFDDNLWNAIWKVLCSVYGSESPKRPSKFPENIKLLRKMIKDFQDNNIELLGEFPSCNATNAKVIESEEVTDDQEPYIKPLAEAVSNEEKVTADDMMACAHRVQKWLTEIYQLCRTTANEILVFTANDLDRQYHAELNNAHPIAYALKGSSMSNECFKQMVQHVITACEEHDLNVLATSSDGQWHRFGVRNWTDEPLTIYQLQKDMWNEEKAKPKSTVLSEIRETMVVRSISDVRFEKAHGSLIVYGHVKYCPIKVFKCKLSRFAKKNETTEAKSDSTVLQNDESILCDIANVLTNSCTQSDETILDNVLSLDNISLVQATDEESCEINNSKSNNDYLNETSNNDTETQGTVESYSDNILPLSVVNQNDEVSQNHSMVEQVTDSIARNVSDTCENLGWGIENAYNTLYSDFYCDQQYVGSHEYTNAVNEYQETLGTLSSVSYRLTTNRGMDYNNSAANGSNLGRCDGVVTVTSPREENVLYGPTSTTQPCQSGNDNIQIPEQSYQDEDKVISEILTALRSSGNELKQKTWNGIDELLLKKYIHDESLLSKHMTVKELLIALETVKNITERPLVFRKSWKKELLVKCLTSSIKNEPVNVKRGSKKRKTHSPPKLSKLTYDIIRNVPKEVLNSVMCENKWEEACNRWQARGPFNSLVLDQNENVSEEINWFSQPHVDERGKPRYHYTDCSHILTCLRTKICTTGITGLQKQAWVDAAKSGQTALNIGIVVECIDKQSVPFAKRVFGEDVEKYMITNSYDNEALFTRLIRRWYDAEDEPAISAKDRVSRRLELRTYLLNKAQFGCFPPKTQYIGGIPVVTFEALLVHLERKLQIYQHLPFKGYNARALGTQEVEQFFSSVRELDPSGLGTPKPDDIPMMMAKAAFLDNIRFNPNR